MCLACAGRSRHIGHQSFTSVPVDRRADSQAPGQGLGPVTAPPLSPVPWGVRWGRQERPGLVTVSDLPFHCGSNEPTLALWFMALTSPPLASHIFKLFWTSFWAPRRCSWEPDNYGLAGRVPTAAQAGPGPGDWLGGASRALRRPDGQAHPDSREVAIWKWASGSWWNGMCVLKDRLELARRRDDMLATGGGERGPDLSSSVWGPLCLQARERSLLLGEPAGASAGKASFCRWEK